MSAEPFSYPNENSSSGRLLSITGRVLPGVGRVGQQKGPYAAAWRESNAAAMAGDGPLWVALGDSLSQGLGAPAYDRGWVGQLRTRLAEAGRPTRVLNLSVTGARTADVLERQLPVLESLPAQPQLVTMLLGSNDLLRRAYRTGLATRFAAILARLPRGSVVSTLPNPTRTAAAVNALIERASRERGLVIAELRDPRTTSWRGKLAEDHFHPNERGHAALADVFAQALGLSSDS